MRGAGGMLAAVAVLAPGCAHSDEHVARELSALREELAAQRRAQSELRDRIERLEARPVAVSPRRPQTPGNEGDPLSALPVVRLERPPQLFEEEPAGRPARGAPAAPALDTRIALREPSDDDLAALERERPFDMNAAVDRRDPKADGVFADAVRLLNDGNRRDAIPAFLSFAETFPRHDAADNALYLAGMAQVFDGRCDAAGQLFEQVLQRYPGQDAVAPALLALGQCESSGGKTDLAQKHLHRILQDFPHTAEASQAEASLAELHQARKP